MNRQIVVHNFEHSPICPEQLISLCLHGSWVEPVQDREHFNLFKDGYDNNCQKVTICCEVPVFVSLNKFKGE
jgi:hypothetical protein